MVNVVVLEPRQSFFASAAIGNSVDLNRHKRIKQQSLYIDIAGGTSTTNALVFESLRQNFKGSDRF